MYQKKGKWLFWGCEGAILKLIGPGYSSSSPQTSIWCGQGSPFVDKMPTALGITAGANYVRRPIRLNDPKAAPAQVAPDTFDRLKDIQEYNRDPNKGNKGPNWTAYGPGLNPGRSVTNGFKDVLIGQNAREHYVMNHFKNECDIRTAYVAEWSRMGGNVPAPINNQAGQANLYFPHAASDLAKTTSYSSDSKFQSIKAPWVKIDLKPRFLPVKGFKGLVCLDDPFSWNLWISTTTVGKTILTQPNNTWATQPRIQIESMWHLAEVSLESLTPILMQMMFLFLKRHHWDIPVTPRMSLLEFRRFEAEKKEGEGSWLEGWSGKMDRAPILDQMNPVAAQACLEITQEKDFDVYKFLALYLEEPTPIIGNMEDYLSPNHP